jgi:polyhydroxybutyrate depolymerase
MITYTTRPGRMLRLSIATLLICALIASSCADGDDPVAESGSTTAGDSATPSTVAPSDDDTVASVECTSIPTGVSEFVLDAGGAEHDVRVYLPTTFDGSSELPLVMNFHGFGSNGGQQAALTGYEDLAEEAGFAVVHPTGVPASSDDANRNSWEVADLDDPAKDDLAFANELLDLLIGGYCVDESRVYATGMSGGGLFTSRLVCDMSERIAAASSVAALAYSDSCEPARPVPYMAIHGTEDETVPFDGDLTGTRFEAEEFARVLFSEPIPEQFAQFAEAMGCDPESERVQQSTDIFATTYNGCDDDVPLEFYEVVNGGHAWPSSPLAERLTELQGYITAEIDATADSWVFFQQHQLEG